VQTTEPQSHSISYSAPADPLAITKEGEGKGKEKVGNREGEEREKSEGVGSDRKGREGSTWIFVQGPQVLSYNTGTNTQRKNEETRGR